jgi:hypothetical protein
MVEERVKAILFETGVMVDKRTIAAQLGDENIVAQTRRRAALVFCLCEVD